MSDKVDRQAALAALHRWQYPETEQDRDATPESIILALPSASTEYEDAAVALAEAVPEDWLIDASCDEGREDDEGNNLGCRDVFNEADFEQMCLNCQFTDRWYAFRAAREARQG